MYTDTEEDYLKAIYILQSEGKGAWVSNSDLANRLGVSPASVTGMLKKLARGKSCLVNYQRYRGVRLTPEGEGVALKVIRNHRLVESFLVQALGYSWDEVHQEAEVLEHAVSDTLGARLAASMDHPERDPHGDPIPASDGTLADQHETPLTESNVGEIVKISRVCAEDPGFLRYLRDLGMTPGIVVEVREKAPYGGPIHVRLSGTGPDLSLSEFVTDQVFVIPRM